MGNKPIIASSIFLDAESNNIDLHDHFDEHSHDNEREFDDYDFSPVPNFCLQKLIRTLLVVHMRKNQAIVLPKI